jgi:hypothetical protein
MSEHAEGALECVGKNKHHSVTEGTWDSAKFYVFCAISKQKFFDSSFVSNNYD